MAPHPRLLFFAVVFALLTGLGLAQLSFRLAFGISLFLTLLIVAIANDELALYFLIFSMLLSPEIVVGELGGAGRVVAFFLGVIALQNRQANLGWLAIALLSGCLGFLPHNFKPSRPATIFLGECGSTFLGFTLATMAVLGEWSPRGPLIAFTVPLLIFGILIFDMIHITIARVATGRVTSFKGWIEYTARDHLHHRLATLFGSNRKSVSFIFLAAICLGITAIILWRATPLEAILLFAQGAIIILIISILERQGNKRSNGERGG